MVIRRSLKLAFGLMLVSSMQVHAEDMIKVRTEFEIKKAKLIQGIKDGIKNLDMRQSGAFNPFKVAVKAGFIDSQEGVPYWEASGGGQPGTFVTFTKDGRVILSRSNIIATHVSNVYCDPSARMLVKKGSWSESAVYAINPEKKEFCMEIGVETSLDAGNLLWETPNNGDRKRGLLLPDVSVTFSANDKGGIDTKVNYGGRYFEKIYVWPITETRGQRANDYLAKNPMPLKYDESYHEAMEAYVVGEPVAATDQGELSTSHYFEELKLVPWSSYYMVPRSIDVEKAKSELGLFTAGQDAKNAVFVLTVLAEHQKLVKQREDAARAEGLFGTEEFQQAAQVCSDSREKGKKASESCVETNKIYHRLANARAENSTQKSLREQAYQQMTRLDSTLQSELSKAQTEPKFMLFMMKISAYQK